MIGIVRAQARALPLIAQPWPRGRRATITPHILYELYAGLSNSPDPRAEERAIDRLGETFGILPFDRRSARLAARMRDGLRRSGLAIPERDLFIAASALAGGDGEIVTRDLAHFGRLQPFGLRVVAG